MKKMELWYCDDFPTQDELIVSVDLAREKDCYVFLHYRINGCGSTHLVQIDPQDTVDTVKNKLTAPFIGGTNY